MKKFIALFAVVLLTGCAAVQKQANDEDQLGTVAEEYYNEGHGYPIGSPPPRMVRSSRPPLANIPEVSVGPEEQKAYAPVISGGSGFEETGEKVVRSIPEPTKPSFEDVVSQLKTASFGYNTPEQMNIDEEATVRLVVNPAKTEAEVETIFKDGSSVTGRILVSNVLVAKLTSRDFDVVSLTPERQALDNDLDTVWVWTIKPKKAGDNRRFNINVSAIIAIDGDKVERAIDTYDGNVNVTITTKQVVSNWISSHWQWAWSALFIPVVMFFWNKRKKNKSTVD